MRTTKQFRWILTLADNLQALFHDRPNVFLSGNQVWYPVAGEPQENAAPDVYVVFGRPRGERTSYKQWEEDNIPMTVVFEVRSPGNDHWELIDKQIFYEEHGVEEYYLYDPDWNRLDAFLRQGAVFRRVREFNNFVSPRLGIRFDLSGAELVVRYPDGRPFLTFAELAEDRRQAERRSEALQRHLDRLAELTRKLLRQEATPEEIEELRQLSQVP